MVELLLIDILSPFVLLDFCPETSMSEQLQMVQRVGIVDKPSIVFFSPILQVLDEVDECRLVKYILLSERLQVVRICEGLDKF